MSRRKHRLSPQALSYWLFAIACAFVGYILPTFVTAVLESELRDLPEDLLAHLSQRVESEGLYVLESDERLLAYQRRQALVANIATLAANYIPWGFSVYFGVAGRRAQKEFNTRLMQQRSAEAKRETLDAVRTGEAPPPFFLYLRPFYADELLVDNPEISSVPFLPSHYYDSAVSWESVFTDRVEQFGRLVSLGTSSDSLSADRIESADSSWVYDFVLLASFAERIFVWPSARPGTRWEIKWLLRQNLVHKCIFVIDNGYDKLTELCGDTWDYVRAFLLMLGFAPPLQRGVMFSANVTSPLVRPLQLSPRKAHKTLSEFMSVTRTVDIGERWKLWQRAEFALNSTPPNWDTDELDILLPCILCGRALTEIVCAVCEGGVLSEDSDLALVSAEDAACPTFDALGRLQITPIASVANAG